jgi:transposase
MFTSFLCKQNQQMIKREILEPLSKDDIINIFVEFTEKVEKQIEELKEDVRVLKEENQQLKQSQNSRNSSRPPSHDFGKVPRQKSLRQPGNKQSGGQPGHKGCTLPQNPEPDKIIVHNPEERCSICGKQHSPVTFKFHSKRQVVDIPPIKAVVTEHRAYKSICSCGHVSVGKFPAGVHAPVQYGNQLTAFVSYLSTRQYIAFKRIPELLKCICNISLSEGTVFNMLERVAKGLQPAYEGIRKNILSAKTVGSDETGIKVENKNYWAWTWQTPTETLISIAPKRGFGTIKNEFPEGLPTAVLVSDSLAAQLKTPALKHQLCLAHLLRELNAFIEISDNPWPVKLKSLLEMAIRVKKELDTGQYNKFVPEREIILKEFNELINDPPESEIKKLSAFHKRLKKWNHSVFTFLFYPDVPFDNNGSERAIRNIKVKQKVSGGFRSARGANIFAITRSVIDTWIKREIDAYSALKFTLHLNNDKIHFFKSQTT